MFSTSTVCDVACAACTRKHKSFVWQTTRPKVKNETTQPWSTTSTTVTYERCCQNITNAWTFPREEGIHWTMYTVTFKMHIKLDMCLKLQPHRTNPPSTYRNMLSMSLATLAPVLTTQYQPCTSEHLQTRSHGNEEARQNGSTNISWKATTLLLTPEHITERHHHQHNQHHHLPFRTAQQILFLV